MRLRDTASALILLWPGLVKKDLGPQLLVAIVEASLTSTIPLYQATRTNCIIPKPRSQGKRMEDKISTPGPSSREIQKVLVHTDKRVLHGL